MLMYRPRVFGMDTLTPVGSVASMLWGTPIELSACKFTISVVGVL